jgi:uncharacterized protein YdeI (YjbR/CyaY-like superfamily)
MKLKTLDVRTRKLWRSWLREHHDSDSEVWRVFHKLHAARKSISSNDALDEALCFGWIDSLMRRLDANRYARKFTPRKPDSRWSTINRRRYAKRKSIGHSQHRARPEHPRTAAATHHCGDPGR